MNVILFGTPDFVIPVLQTLLDHFTIVGVVTSPDELVGRKQILTASPVKVFADQHTLRVFQPKKLNNDTSSELKTLSPDLIVVASYGKLIPQEILDIPKLGALNIHPSALPKYRGPSPIQTAILNGETETEVDIIKMDAELDHGPILARQKLEILPYDTFQSLVKRAFRVGAEMLPETIEKFAKGEIIPAVQDHERATYTKHFTRESGYIDVQSLPSKDQIDRMIHAFYPWPNVWTKIDGKIIKFTIPKTILTDFPIVTQIQMGGKNVVSKKDFLNGYPQYREIIEKII